MKRLKLFLRCYREQRRSGCTHIEAWRCGWAFARMVIKHGIGEVGPRVRPVIVPGAEETKAWEFGEDPTYQHQFFNKDRGGYG